MSLAERVCNRRSALNFRRNQSPTRTIRPTSPIQYAQKPSRAHSNPIGRSPRPSRQRLTSNGPIETARQKQRRSALPRLSGSPDWDLTFPRTYSQFDPEIAVDEWFALLSPVARLFQRFGEVSNVPVFFDPLPELHSSRSSFKGSAPNARCAGIQVASRPSSSMARTTPANTSGSRGVA
jgi:hypothetical protein